MRASYHLKAFGDIPLIDAHIHALAPHLPGSRAASLWADEELISRVERMRHLMSANGVAAALTMGDSHVTASDPVGLNATLELATELPHLYCIAVAKPGITDPGHLHRVNQALRNPKVKAIKCYLGYEHVGPEDTLYRPYYQLAEEHNLPVVFHTGDTYSAKAKVKFAHPLRVDEVAVDFPNVRFVLAHFGNPWMLDAAEVIYKNDNVWADLSAIVVGDSAWFEDAGETGLLKRTASRVREAFEYAEKPDRFVFGSDWPLNPINRYADFVRSATPEDYHNLVFEANAAELFNLPIGTSTNDGLASELP